MSPPIGTSLPSIFPTTRLARSPIASAGDCFATSSAARPKGCGRLRYCARLPLTRNQVTPLQKGRFSSISCRAMFELTTKPRPSKPPDFEMMWLTIPISAYRTIEGSNKELADKIFVSLSPKGPATRRSFANCRAYGVTKFSKNADGAKAFLEALVDDYREAAKASTGYNMPFLKNYAKPPFPILSEDPKLKPLEQDAEYHFTTGYPGPLTPAADEVYQQFVMVDALAQFATDKMDLEQTVKWAEDKIKAIYAKFV